MIRLGTVRTIHFIGIGGIGMSALAEFLAHVGYAVTGSDLQSSGVSERLTQRGIAIQFDHAPRLIKQCDLAIYSSAIRQDNPERQWAALHGRQIMRRAELLGEIMRSYFGIAVAGTHGKTTTTAMIGEVFSRAKCEPVVLVGGIVRAWQTNALMGREKI
ncbi:MAG: Mur ligase domain-containing protein, partial [Chitinivibrionales bacterium]|nr:Mur ligase domain-containing protein [Chitinivibrionales bacterium]